MKFADETIRVIVLTLQPFQKRVFAPREGIGRRERVGSDVERNAHETHELRLKESRDGLRFRDARLFLKRRREARARRKFLVQPHVIPEDDFFHAKTRLRSLKAPVSVRRLRSRRIGGIRAIQRFMKGVKSFVNDVRVVSGLRRFDREERLREINGGGVSRRLLLRRRGSFLTADYEFVKG